MRIVLALMFLLMASAAQAQSPGDRAAIETVITRQLDAFRQDDAQAAFAQASPMIQHMFGTPENFIAMVAHGYPPVYRPRQTTFGPLELQADQFIQKVEIVGPDGASYLALYAMERQPDGSWKIGGCQLTESESLGA